MSETKFNIQQEKEHHSYIVGTLGFGILYLIFSVAHLFALEAPQNYIMFSMAIATALINLVAYSHARKVKFYSLSYSSLGLIGILTLASINILVHGLYLNDPKQVISFGLVQLAISVTVTTRVVYILMSVVIAIEILIFPYTFGFNDFLTQYLFIHLSVIILATTIYLQRLKNIAITTELKHTQNEIYKEQIEREKSRTINSLAGGVAHEINNPLMVLKGNLQIIDLTLKKVDSEHKERLGELSQKALHAISRMSEITSSLVTYSNSINTKGAKEIYINEFIDEIYRHWKPILYLNKIELRKNIDVPNETFVESNKRDLLQVLFSLIENSQDMLTGIPQSWVLIEAKTNGSDLIITVTDSGDPIPQEKAPKIFDPFYSGKPIGQGKGLGLAIAKTLLERYNAKIEYDIDSPTPCFIITFAGAADTDKIAVNG